MAQQKPSGPEHKQAAAEEPSQRGQDPVPASPSPYEVQSLSVSQEANRIAKRSADAAVRQADYSLSQVVLGGFATFFTALAAIAAIAAAYYAKHAAQAARESAKADNAALTETRKAARAARKDAAEAAERFKAQIADSREMVEFTAKSAYAMDHSATATRALARATRESAAKQLRPYLYLTDEKFSLARIADGQRGTEVVEATFSIRNFGQTPAKRVRFKAATFLGGYWSEDYTPDFSAAVWVHLADIPPGADRPWDDETGYRLHPFERADRYAVEEETASVIFHGVIEYTDADGTQYETKFRRAATGRGFWVRPIVTEHGNEAT